MKTNINLSPVEKSEIIMYQPDESIRLEVRMEADTVWLTQAQMAILFGVDRTVIVKHVGNIFKTKELDEIFVRTALPPKEGIFFDGQIFDAYAFVSDLIRQAKQRIVLIDDTQLYTFGGSFKDLGKKLFCFNLMEDPTLVAAVHKMIH